jgi:hypothetical protein
VLGEFERELLGEHPDASLGRVVVDLPGPGPRVVKARDVEDVAAVTLLAKLPARSLRQPKDRVEVDRADPLPLVVGQVECRRDGFDRRVVDQYVQAFELRNGAVDELLRGTVCGDVTLDGDRLAPAFGHRSRGGGRRVAVDIVDEDLEAVRRQLARDGGSDSPSGTGDECCWHQKPIGGRAA